MSETNEQQNQEEQKDQRVDQPDLMGSLRDLGHQLDVTLRGILTSERTRSVQADVTEGLREIGSQVQSMAKAIQENPNIQALVDRGQQAVDQVQGSHVVKEFQDILANGFTHLSEQIAHFAEKMQTSAESRTGVAPSEQTPPAQPVETPPESDK